MPAKITKNDAPNWRKKSFHFQQPDSQIKTDFLLILVKISPSENNLTKNIISTAGHLNFLFLKSKQ